MTQLKKKNYELIYCTYQYKHFYNFNEIIMTDKELGKVINILSITGMIEI